MHPEGRPAAPKEGKGGSREARHYQPFGKNYFGGAELLGERTIKNKRQDKE